MELNGSSAKISNPNIKIIKTKEENKKENDNNNSDLLQKKTKNFEKC